jgi:ribose 1,5-bisphosphokinase PhnN
MLSFVLAQCAHHRGAFDKKQAKGNVALHWQACGIYRFISQKGRMLVR